MLLENRHHPCSARHCTAWLWRSRLASSFSDSDGVQGGIEPLPGREPSPSDPGGPRAEGRSCTWPNRDRSPSCAARALAGRARGWERVGAAGTPFSGMGSGRWGEREALGSSGQVGSPAWGQGKLVMFYALCEWPII